MSIKPGTLHIHTWLPRWQFGLVTGIAGGLAVGLQELLELWTVPLPRAATVTPASSSRIDRQMSIVRRLAYGIATGLAVGLAGGITDGLVFGITYGLTVGLTGGFVDGLMPKVSFTELLLAITGAGRVRFMRVLEDAHHRQVLRQAGAVYQFRHAELQDRLAEIHRRRTQHPTGT